LSIVIKERKPKTMVYTIWSKCSDCELGEVRWHPSWRHYCFFPTLAFETVYSDRCLALLGAFVADCNFKHKNANDI
jgi:hypothetical protein